MKWAAVEKLKTINPARKQVINNYDGNAVKRDQLFYLQRYSIWHFLCQAQALCPFLPLVSCLDVSENVHSTHFYLPWHEEGRIRQFLKLVLARCYRIDNVLILPVKIDWSESSELDLILVSRNSVICSFVDIW